MGAPKRKQVVVPTAATDSDGDDNDHADESESAVSSSSSSEEQRQQQQLLQQQQEQALYQQQQHQHWLQHQQMQQQQQTNFPYSQTHLVPQVVETPVSWQTVMIIVIITTCFIALTLTLGSPFVMPFFSYMAMRYDPESHYDLSASDVERLRQEIATEATRAGEQRLRLHGQPAATGADGVVSVVDPVAVTHAWSSPILHTNVADVFGTDVAKWNAHLAAGISGEYARFIDGNAHHWEQQQHNRPHQQQQQQQQALTDAADCQHSSTCGASDMDAVSTPSPSTSSSSSPKDDTHWTSDRNNMFYQWQTEGGGWNRAFARRPEFKLLRQRVLQMTDTFLRHLQSTTVHVESSNTSNRSPPVGDELADTDICDQFASARRGRATASSKRKAEASARAFTKRDISFWATCHKGHMRHARHEHGTELFSGVYYVKLPADAGAIVFEDPRGPRPPFDRHITIYPRAGDLILFPSWLVHSVRPTVGNDERISIAFNVVGDIDAAIAVKTVHHEAA